MHVRVSACVFKCACGRAFVCQVYAAEPVGDKLELVSREMMNFGRYTSFAYHIL